LSRPAAARIDFTAQGYERLANEYYDPMRHPTCANFREGSRIVLGGWLGALSLDRLTFADVGCGRSILAELVETRLPDLGRIRLIDSSPTMLAFSGLWAKRGAQLILSDATSLALPAQSIDVLISSLGDPYNSEAFWSEAARVVRGAGLVLYTTPSYEWAKAFRVDGAMLSLAQFELADGSHVSVPSYVLPPAEQIELVGQHSFVVDKISEVPISALRDRPISPKLLPNRGLNVVTGYAFRRSPLC